MFLIARSVSRWYPELFLIISVIIYWASAGQFLNPIAIILLTLLFSQLTYKSRTLGLVIASILVLLVSYLFIALISDILNAKSFIWSGLKMTIIGSGYLFITGYYSVVLFMKNIATTPDRYPLGSD
ncbi:hypothetical protein [Patiriisocius marinus]|uniref:hypothetical protein n=1 Tax=Patiriisocius marinus TaxID=1397112 RepID=UPI00232F10F4|nr:hypothetical protein [Patiriisocius marinus]